MNMHPLRRYRLSKTPKQSQADLAQELDVARLTLLRWEAGSNIDEKKILDVAKKTGIPVKDLRPDLVERLEQLIGSDQ